MVARLVQDLFSYPYETYDSTLWQKHIQRGEAARKIQAAWKGGLQRRQCIIQILAPGMTLICLDFMMGGRHQAVNMIAFDLKRYQLSVVGGSAETVRKSVEALNNIPLGKSAAFINAGFFCRAGWHLPELAKARR